MDRRLLRELSSGIDLLPIPSTALSPSTGMGPLGQNSVTARKATDICDRVACTRHRANARDTVSSKQHRYKQAPRLLLPSTDRATGFGKPSHSRRGRGRASVQASLPSQLGRELGALTQPQESWSHIQRHEMDPLPGYRHSRVQTNTDTQWSPRFQEPQGSSEQGSHGPAWDAAAWPGPPRCAERGAGLCARPLTPPADTPARRPRAEEPARARVLTMAALCSSRAAARTALRSSRRFRTACCCLLKRSYSSWLCSRSSWFRRVRVSSEGGEPGFKAEGGGRGAFYTSSPRAPRGSSA